MDAQYYRTLKRKYTLNELVLLTISKGDEEILKYKGDLNELLNVSDNDIQDIEEFYKRHEIVIRYFYITFKLIPYKYYKKIFIELQELIEKRKYSYHSKLFTPLYFREAEAIYRKYRLMDKKQTKIK